MNERRLTVTAAARNFSDVVNRAHYRHESTLLMKNGTPVARIVPVGPKSITAAELASQWKDIRHLTPSAAESFERDIRRARKGLRLPEIRWE